MDSRSPKATCELWLSGAVARANESYFKSFTKAVLAGMLLSLGGAVALKIGGGSPLLASQNPGLNALISAAIFPIGLVAIVLTGSDLCTANMAVFIIGHIKGKVAWYAGILNLLIVTFGNLCGALLVSGLLIKGSGLYSTEALTTYIVALATTKTIVPSFGMIVVRGIGCNFLVCLGVWQAASAREIYSKILAAYLPIFVFVAIGFDHVVANMLYIPAALMLGPGSLTTSIYIVKQIIAPWIGNLIGAAFFVAPMAYIYLYDDEMILPGPGPISSSASSSGTETPLKKEMSGGRVSIVD